MNAAQPLPVKPITKRLAKFDAEWCLRPWTWTRMIDSRRGSVRFIVFRTIKGSLHFYEFTLWLRHDVRQLACRRLLAARNYFRRVSTICVSAS